MVLDAEGHAVLAQHGFSQRNGLLATVEVLLKSGEGVELFVAALSHRRVERDDAGLLCFLDRIIEGGNRIGVAGQGNVGDSA